MQLQCWRGPETHRLTDWLTGWLSNIPHCRPRKSGLKVALEEQRCGDIMMLHVVSVCLLRSWIFRVKLESFDGDVNLHHHPDWRRISCSVLFFFFYLVNMPMRRFLCSTSWFGSTVRQEPILTARSAELRKSFARAVTRFSDRWTRRALGWEA